MADSTRKLENTLEVDGELYDINAVHALVADQVSQKLIIQKQLSEDTQESLEYNGKEEKEIAVVPASGGTFVGPVYGPTIESIRQLYYELLKEDFDETDEEYADYDSYDEFFEDWFETWLLQAGLGVLTNREDVNNVVADLCGLPCCLWQRTEGDGGEIVMQLITALTPGDVTIPSFKIILGLAEDAIKLKEYSDCPKNYLYIATDTGEIFVGHEKDEEAVQIKLAQQAASSEIALKIVKDLSKPDQDFYNYDSIKQAFANLEEQLDNNYIDILDEADSKIETHNTDQEAHPYLRNVLEHVLATGQLPEDIVDAVLTVAKANEATNAANADNATMLNNKTAAHYQGTIFIGTEQQRDSQMSLLRGSTTPQENDIWLCFE
jgi:hypothetical protein